MRRRVPLGPQGRRRRTSSDEGRGAETIAQDEGGCVVFGMPREAIALGVVDNVAALSDILAAILKYAARPVRMRGTR